MILKEAWRQTLRLYAEGDKLRVEGSKLIAEGDKLYVEAHKLYAEAHKLYAEAHKLYAEAHKLYAEAVDGFFEPGPSIDWLTGDVEGKPLPIPACELGI